MAELGRFLKRIDLFRHIDESYLSTATTHGGTLTIAAYVIMCVLAVFEFSAYMTSQTTSTVVMDVNQDQSLLIAFNITMLDLPCKFAAVDVYDAFGFERQNVTSDITKTRLHLVGDRLVDGGAGSEETKISEESDSEESPKEIELDDEGHHALDLKGQEGFEQELRTHDYTLMNFYAPWCHWCKALAPTYEKAADKFDEIEFTHKRIRAKFASLNCEKYSNICRKYKVRAYPTLLIFNYDKPVYPRYDGDRSVDSLVDFLKKAVLDYETHMPNIFHDQACRIEGYINVARVPGNFHVEARSQTEDLSPAMANLSHIVHHLQFGNTLVPALEKKLPTRQQFMIHPLDGEVFILEKVHAAPQHYIKVVTTMYEFENGQRVSSYQLTTQNRVATYQSDEIPEAKFTYDMSPVSVIVSQRRQPFYSFLTSLFAIIGGAFTVISLCDGAVETVNVRLKRTLGKLS